MIDTRDEIIDSLPHQLSGFGSTRITVVHSRSDSEQQLDKVQEQLSLFRVSNPGKRRSTLPSRDSVSHESPRAAKGAQKTRSDGSWRNKISRVNRKRQRRTGAHGETLALLTRAEAARRDGEEKRVSLEEGLHMKVAGKGELLGGSEGLQGGAI